MRKLQPTRNCTTPVGQESLSLGRQSRQTHWLVGVTAAAAVAQARPAADGPLRGRPVAGTTAKRQCWHTLLGVEASQGLCKERHRMSKLHSQPAAAQHLLAGEGRAQGTGTAKENDGQEHGGWLQGLPLHRHARLPVGGHDERLRQRQQLGGRVIMSSWSKCGCPGQTSRECGQDTICGSRVSPSGRRRLSPGQQHHRVDCWAGSMVPAAASAVCTCFDGSPGTANK